MAYHRESASEATGQHASPAPAGVTPEYDAADMNRERRHQELVAVGKAFASSHPHLTDAENYPREAFAGPTRRLLAFCLDCIVVMPAALFLAWLLGGLPGQEESVLGFNATYTKLAHKIVQVVIYDLYFAGMLGLQGQTWGMHFAGFKVVRRTLARPSMGMARGRYWALGLGIVALGLGPLSMLWNRHRRGWHDRVSGTYALNTTHLDIGLLEYVNTPPDESAQQRINRKSWEGFARFAMIVFSGAGLLIVVIAVHLLIWLLRLASWFRKVTAR